MFVKIRERINKKRALIRIGMLVCKELSTNRQFRRQLENTPLGRNMLIEMQTFVNKK
jgi:hypothetical protein